MEEMIACQYPQCIPTIPQWLPPEFQQWFVLTLLFIGSLGFILWMIFYGTPDTSERIA